MGMSKVAQKQLKSDSFLRETYFWVSLSYCPCRTYYWIISGKGGSGKFLDFFTELVALRLIPVICHARSAKPENYWDRWWIPDRAYPAMKSEVFLTQIFIPGNILGSAMALVPTVLWAECSNKKNYFGAIFDVLYLLWGMGSCGRTSRSQRKGMEKGSYRASRHDYEINSSTLYSEPAGSGPIPKNQI